MTTLALTGGTGFVGKRLIDLALAEGHHIRALARREQPARAGVTWVAGALDRPDSLVELASGADAILHVAGVVNAPARADFIAGNIDGTRAMLAAAGAAGVQRFVQVSSLAAREPQLSTYGWSKAEADRLVKASSLDWSIVRPTAVYGPGDMDNFELFRMAKLGMVPLPPRGRMSAIHVDDLARLLLALAGTTGHRAIMEASDGAPDGYTHVEFARSIGQAVGRNILPLPLPRALLSLAAAGDRLVRGDKARLTADRVAYFCHPDWTADPAKAPPAALWHPNVALTEGLADTAKWYRAQGLL